MGPSLAVLPAVVMIAAIASASQAAPERPEQFRAWGTSAQAHPYLAPPEPGELVARGIQATTAEQAAGLVLLTAPPTAVVEPGDPLTSSERCTGLAARDCPGQYGPVTFTVVALRDAAVSVEVSDLAGPGGAEIPRNCLDLRRVRYVGVGAGDQRRIVPLLLESFDDTPLLRGQTQQFWITYCLPEGSAPGEYGGSVRVSLNGTQAAEVPLRIRVNPFVLDEPGCNLYIYHSTPSGPDADERLRQELIDQRCHGMTMGMLDPPVTRDGDLTAERLRILLDTYKAAGFPDSHFHMGLWNRITSEWLNEPDRSIGMWGAWFRYYPFSAELDERYVRTVRTIRDEARARRLELILAVADETGSHAWTIPATMHYLDLIKAQVPDVTRELTVGGGWAMGEPEHEHWRGRLDIWSTNRWLADKLQIVRAAEPDVRIQVYNMGGPGSAPGGLQSSRDLYGFFAWRAGVGGVAQWVYNHSSTPDHNYAWPADDGEGCTIPTLRWEAVREGAKDRRYLATLEDKLDERTGPEADGARALLAELRDKVELRTGDYDPIDGGRIPAHAPGTYDAWRARIADAIETLDGP